MVAIVSFPPRIVTTADSCSNAKQMLEWDFARAQQPDIARPECTQFRPSLHVLEGSFQTAKHNRDLV